MKNTKRLYLYVHVYYTHGKVIQITVIFMQVYFHAKIVQKNSNEKLFAQKSMQICLYDICDIFARSIFRFVYVILLSKSIIIVGFTCFNFSSNVYTCTFNIPLVGLTVVLLRGFVKHHCVVGDLAVTCRRQRICY